MATMTDNRDREEAIQEIMREQRLSERMARFIYAMRCGEIPGDVVYVRDGEIVRGISAIPLRGDKQETVQEPAGVS